MSHHYQRCPGDPSNPCKHARKCPYRGDRVACAQAVENGRWNKPETKRTAPQEPQS